ncbi:MAG: chemotaxis protein CheW [Nitrospira sp.]|nr:chemotaxis protein CheW [Nitrospira sp.]
MSIREPIMETPSPASPLRFLIVTLCGRYLALDAESICGLLTFEEAGNVENPMIHGIMYGAINLADRLGLPDDQGDTNTHVLLLSEREARGSVRVTTVEGLLELSLSQVLPIPMQFRGPERHWYRGMILVAKSIALVLNTSWVFNEEGPAKRGSGDVVV